MGTEAAEVEVQDDLTADLAAAWGDSDETGAENTETAPAGGWEGDEPTETPDGDATAAADDTAGGEVVTGAPAGGSAPQSFSVGAREAWKDVPEAVKAEINKREQDYSQGIQKYAESAHRAEKMDRSLQPYQQYMQMNGGPSQSIQSLLQTGSSLQMGSPIQKAEIIAGLIGQFGVDVQALDGMLAGTGVSPEMEQQENVQRQIQAAVQPYQQHMQQLQWNQQRDQQQTTGRINGEINQFSTANEFYNDVKMQMADVLDLAANRGQQMDLKTAYDTACQLNPEISKIVKARAQAASVQSRRRAGSSVHGTPGGPGGSESHADDVRDAIEDAWDSAGTGAGRV